MPFLSPTSRNHFLDLIFSLITKTPEQGRGVTPLRQLSDASTLVKSMTLSLKAISTVWAAVAEWLSWRTCTQRTWVQLSLVPYKSLVAAGKTSGQNCSCAPEKKSYLGRRIQAPNKAVHLDVWIYQWCGQWHHLTVFQASKLHISVVQMCKITW